MTSSNITLHPVQSVGSEMHECISMNDGSKEEMRIHSMSVREKDK